MISTFTPHTSVCDKQQAFIVQISTGWRQASATALSQGCKRTKQNVEIASINKKRLWATQTLWYYAIDHIYSLRLLYSDIFAAALMD